MKSDLVHLIEKCYKEDLFHSNQEEYMAMYKPIKESIDQSFLSIWFGVQVPASFAPDDESAHLYGQICVHNMRFQGNIGQVLEDFFKEHGICPNVTINGTIIRNGEVFVGFGIDTNIIKLELDKL